MSGTSKPSPQNVTRAIRRLRALPPEVQRGEVAYEGAMLCVCSCVVSLHKGNGHRGKCESCGRCQRYREDAVDRLVRQALVGVTTPFASDLAERRQAEYDARPKAVKGPGEWSVRASDLDGCRREMGYRNGLDPDAVPVPKANGEALAGQDVEDSVVEVYQDKYPWREFQVEVQIKGLHSPGRVDAYDGVIGMVEEIKSAGEWMWEQVITFGARWYHRGQALLYASGLEAAGRFVSFVRVHYIKRGNYALEEIFDIPWDDEARAEVEEHRARLIGFLTSLDRAHATGKLPPRDRSGPSHPLCQRCDWLETCWNVQRAKATGRDPMSLTMLGEHPDARRIAWAVQEIVTLREVYTAAKRKYDDARHMLDGSIPTAIYEGISKVERGRRGGVNYKTHAELLAERMEQAASRVGQVVQAVERLLGMLDVEGMPGDVVDQAQALLADLAEIDVDPGSVPVPHNEDSAPVAKLASSKDRERWEREREEALQTAGDVA
jgi:hypothetical protein